MSPQLPIGGVPSASSMGASRLWVLQPRSDVLARESHPWTPWFDKVFGLVVRAGSEVEARALAQAHAGHEGLGIYRTLGDEEEELAMDVWLDSTYTSREILEPAGHAEVIVVDRREA